MILKLGYLACLVYPVLFFAYLILNGEEGEIYHYSGTNSHLVGFFPATKQLSDTSLSVIIQLNSETTHRESRE